MIYKRCFMTLITILWMCLIFACSARNGNQSAAQSQSIGRLFGTIVFSDFKEWERDAQEEFAERWDYPIRKLAHFTEYAILGILLAGTFLLWDLSVKEAISLGVAIGIAYAISDEIHQYFVPGRACQLMDMIIDSGGVIIGGLAEALFARRPFKQHKHNC